jgi:hypothetical protein
LRINKWQKKAAMVISIRRSSLRLVKVLNKKGKIAYLMTIRRSGSCKILDTGALLDYAISNRRNGGVPFILNGIEGSGKSLIAIRFAPTQKWAGFLFYRYGKRL